MSDAPSLNAYMHYAYGIVGENAGKAADPSSPDFKGAFQMCDLLGIGRESIEGRCFIGAYIDALRAKG